MPAKGQSIKVIRTKTRPRQVTSYYEPIDTVPEEPIETPVSEENPETPGQKKEPETPPSTPKVVSLFMIGVTLVAILMGVLIIAFPEYTIKGD